MEISISEDMQRFVRYRMRRSLRVGFLTLVAFACTTATGFADRDKDGHPGRRKADLSRLVVVGDSLSAGFQNFSLLDSQQVNGYAYLLAQQAGTPMTLPLIAAPGIPNALTLVSPGSPPVILPAPGFSTGRTNPGAQATNVAVPAAKVQEALTKRPADPGADPLTILVLGIPGLFLPQPMSLSQIEMAAALQPTTVIMWLGSNDILMSASEGSADGITPLLNFQASYAEALARLGATGASVVVANIPDVTTIPYFTPIEKIAGQAGAPLPAVCMLLGFTPQCGGTLITLPGLPLVNAILASGIPSSLPPAVVLDPLEAKQTQDLVNAYNQSIEYMARTAGATLVDINTLVKDIHRAGYVTGGQRLTTDFLGGLFSLDGMHPTNTGYAIIANEFINAMNRNLSAGIPPVSIVSIKKTDPLVLPGVGTPASALR